MKEILKYSNNFYSLTSFSFFLSKLWNLDDEQWSHELICFNGFWQCFDWFAYNAYTKSLNFDLRLE